MKLRLFILVYFYTNIFLYFMNMKVVSQPKNQMIGLPNVSACLGGVMHDCSQNLSAVIDWITTDYPWIIMLIEGMEGEKVIRIILQDLL